MGGRREYVLEERKKKTSERGKDKKKEVQHVCVLQTQSVIVEVVAVMPSGRSEE